MATKFNVPLGHICCVFFKASVKKFGWFSSIPQVLSAPQEKALPARAMFRLLKACPGIWCFSTTLLRMPVEHPGVN